MLKYQVSMSSFLEEFRDMINSIVVKRSLEASLYETEQSKIKAERYLLAIERTMEWSSYGVFDKEVMESLQLSKEVIDAVIYSRNNNHIPYESRDLIMQAQREYIISKYSDNEDEHSYGELNNYYRTLNGLPSIEDMESGKHVLIGENTLEVDPNTPIYKLSVPDLDYFNTSNMRENFIKKYPNKPYLKFLGNRAITIYQARNAKNYEILYIKDTKNKAISRNFRRNYAAARDYVMMGLYSNEDRKTYKEYDGFMGLIIITMAINKTFSDLFKQGISRDFYDDNLLKLLFKNYNIPYEEAVPLKYQKIIAKQLNVLLQKKSSNNVLYDIIKIFNYVKINIYAYYLVKDYKKDSNGDPTIYTKKIIDDNNNEVEVIDYENTYDIFFQRVNIENINPNIELTNPSNRAVYSSLTSPDPYWINDSDLLNKIYESKFNNIITKYLALEVMFDLSKVLYEAGHGFRTVLDRHEDTKLITLDLMYVKEPVSIFDIIIFLNALICKKLNLTGEIPLDPRQIANIYGFNFKSDLDKIRNDIIKDHEEKYRLYRPYKTVDTKILEFLIYKPVRTIDDLDPLFENIDALRNFIDRHMRYTTDYTTYHVYKKLYNALLITKDLPELYIMKDKKTYATTYDMLLEDRRPDLWQFLHSLPDNEIIDYETGDGLEVKNNEELNEVIDTILDSLDDIHESLVDLRYLNNKSNIINSIEKIINQMKSYTVDITEYGLYYILKDPHMCMLKILDRCFIEKNMLFKDKLPTEDIISNIETPLLYKENLNLSVIDLFISRIFKIEEDIELKHKVYTVKEMYLKYKQNTNNIISETNKELINLNSKIKTKDKLIIEYERN